MNGDNNGSYDDAEEKGKKDVRFDEKVVILHYGMRW